MIARLISCTPLASRSIRVITCSLGLTWLLAVLLAQGAGPIAVLSREGRRTLPTVDVQNHQMVGLDDLANLFQLQIREDLAARAVTASHKNQTIVLTPDQPLVSSSGRLVSLPAP